MVVVHGGDDGGGDGGGCGDGGGGRNCFFRGSSDTQTSLSWFPLQHKPALARQWPQLVSRSLQCWLTSEKHSSLLKASLCYLGGLFPYVKLSFT